MKKAIGLFFFLGLVLQTASASVDIYQFDDPEQEIRYRDLVAELRCPKCQNQNLADSDAPLARDIKDKVYAKMQSGETDEAIVEYLVGRYGDFIRYRPPFNLGTAFLWLFPLVLLAVFFMVIAFIVKNQRTKKSGDDLKLVRETAAQLRREYEQQNDSQRGA